MNDTATATARMLEGNLRAFAAHVSAPDDVLDAPRMAELYAYAAACVRRVPDLEAEVERQSAALHAAREDAARWRWIRQFCAVSETEDGEVGLWCDNDSPEPGPVALFLLAGSDWEERDGAPTQTVEELVDAARAANQEGT